ncbi:FtsX-like permease family protein [Flavihumibacter sediminis]|nr:FtsX-like permease family protein [Flavihumibacter sediminis]
MLLKVAWRNTWRSKKRSLIIVASVTIGLFAGIYLMAFYNGMIEQRVNTAILSEISHIQLHHPHFSKDHEISKILQDGPGMLQKIRSNPDINNAAGRIILKGMISSASGSAGITINGINSVDEQSVTGLKDKIVTGAYFTEKQNELLIGEKLLKKLTLKLHGKAILVFQDKNDEIISAAFRIVGVFKTVNTPYDEANVFVEINDIDSITAIPGEYNEIALLLVSNKLLSQTQAELKKQFPGAEINNWMEISPEIGLTVSVSDQMAYIFMGIILLALAFGIVNTMMMAVLERTREIGMLLALGMNRLKVFSMILLETIFLVLAGCPGGILLALAAIAITKRTGISFKKFTEVYSSFGYSDVIYPSLTLKQFGIMLLLVVITAIVSALLPAWKALRLDPAVSIRK